MHIVCCIKQVPDTAEVKIDPETNTLMRSGVESISNPFDRVALEAALRLRERHGGRVTAVSMGPPQAEASLREALAFGADQAILLSDRAFAGADTLATSYTLARAIERIHAEHPVDLVLCGKQAIDGDTAQVGPGIATRLAFTQLTYVVEIQDADEAAGWVQVKRQVEDGHEEIRGPLPALLTVELSLAAPRRASLPLLIRSLRARVEVWDGQAIGGEPDRLGLKGSPTWVKRIFSPPPREGGARFEAGGDPQGAVIQAVDVLWQDETFVHRLTRGWEG
jgi:electron transfer flavoprotein beta subunit